LRVVVADTGPIHYSILIGHIGVLPMLFGKVFLPSVVRDELAHIEAPEKVRGWIGQPPSWLEVLSAPATYIDDASLFRLDSGEKSAIALAASLEAHLVLMDDREGVAAARQKGFAVIGTLGVLDLAARRGLLNLADAFARLKTTNFRYRQNIMDNLLAQHKPTGA
jgi:predicted nucleic acid-binding protein